MSRDAQQIRQEIEETRGQLGQTLEAIGDRVSPRHMVEDLAEKVSPRRLVRRQTERMKEGITNVGDTVKSKANGAVNGIAAATPSLATPGLPKPTIPGVTVPKVDLRPMDRAAGLRDEVSERAHGVTGKVKEVSASAAEQVRSAPENAPLVAGAVAFGAGLALALAVRATSRERQVARTVDADVASPLRARAARVKENVRVELEPRVKEGVERVKRRAVEAQARVRAEAGEASADVRTDVGRAAGDLKRGAKKVTSVARAKVEDKVPTG